ncbi:MAG: transposase [Vicinamibacterales bacterium]
MGELPNVTAFVVDDTGFPKKGTHTVGVARQYSGTLGRTDNCQVATSLHLAGARGSGCIGMRPYLPEAWTTDRARCRTAGVPDTVAFAPKWQHALALLDQALAAGVRRHVVLGDAAFGDVTAFREGLTARGLQYHLRVQGGLVVWPPGARFAVVTAAHVHDNEARVYGDSAYASFTQFDVVEPDLLYMSNERAAQILTDLNVQGVPELVLEIASPSTRRRDASLTRALYDRTGVSESWIVEPTGDRVRAYRRGA